MTTRQPAPTMVYQLKIVLRHISPLIWRRVLVRSDTTIVQLHTIVQVVMGWEGLHLHQFRIHGKAYGSAQLGGLSVADDPHTVTLATFRLRRGERFVYEYDMGDLWQHDIRLEAALPLDPEGVYPLCTAGKGTCPPEDCGGPAGYRHGLEERSSWRALCQAHDDALLVAERLRAWLDGGPRLSDDDEELTEALDRMSARLETTPEAFGRRVVNAALRRLGKQLS